MTILSVACADGKHDNCAYGVCRCSCHTQPAYKLDDLILAAPQHRSDGTRIA